MIEFTPRSAEDAATPAAGKYSLFMTLDGALALKDSDGNVTPYARAEDVPGEYGLPDIIERRQFLSGFLDGNLIGPSNRLVDPASFFMGMVVTDSDLSASNGFISFGNDSLIINWATGAGSTAEGAGTVTWVKEFPTACLFAIPGQSVATANGASDAWCQMVGTPTVTGASFYRQASTGNPLGSAVAPLILAIGC